MHCEHGLFFYNCTPRLSYKILHGSTENDSSLLLPFRPTLLKPKFCSYFSLPRWALLFAMAPIRLPVAGYGLGAPLLLASIQSQSLRDIVT